MSRVCIGEVAAIFGLEISRLTLSKAEVLTAISDLFAVFATCESAYRVVAAFAGRRFPLAPMAGCGPGSCAGVGCRTPGARRAQESLLCRGLRARPLHLGAAGPPGRHRARQDHRTPPPVLIGDHHEGYKG
ncbi:hypothetical protein [Mycobacterium riyadhense]|uniref:Uncharacterized protein n=1 Tax=Mycobacterium riyadhense TaxID=486698 RepID=A0A1X2CCG4_9MYCO|nr:hypothetical protein [Mycobacterium riyadhense]MCV7146961.1 hypothetical protein [Mycobacterium riyadhense]ORW73616.1 hypothetical protein AWC22_23880 [Mycobacterium riyadhense]